MTVFRLCRQRFAELSGFGAKKTGGRWNRKGIAALYTAQNASLAVLEVLVHLDKTELPDDYVMLEISVGDEAIMSIRNEASDQIDALYENGCTALAPGLLGFSVPSAVVRSELVVVLYPESDMGRNGLTISKMAAFSFDPRLFSPVATSRDNKE